MKDDFKKPRRAVEGARSSGKKKTTSWGNVAVWYQESVASEKSYQRRLILPNLVRLMDIRPGEKILETACGEGIMSRAFREAGGIVSAADISPELVALAKKNSPAEIRFEVAPADRMEMFSEGFFDKAAIVLALQNIEADKEAVREIARLLHPGGKLFIVLNHPCFRIPKASEWGYDETRRVQYRRIDRYISESKNLIEMHPGADPREVTVSFHRPLQHYFKILGSSGFAVTRFEEWTSPKVSEPGPRAEAENRARKEIPIFLAFVAVKL